MKILSLRLKNINALKGEFAVDFTRPPLAEAGLFAITGPTGSGKTTLLDVICLALYNQVPRLGKLSKTTIEQSGAILTRHTSEAYAEVTYTCQKGKFTSRWSISTARTGNLRDYDMEISREDGSLIDLKKSEVPAKNAELIGLNFEQFTKSTLLAQGAFAKFLTADRNERSALLEQITGTEIYRKLGQMAYEKYSQVGKVLESLHQTKEQLLQEQLSQEEIKQLEEKLAARDKQIKLLQEEKVRAGKLLDQWSKVHHGEEAIATTKIQVETARQEKEIFEQEQGKALAAHESLAPLSDELKDWVDQQNRLQEIKQQHTKLREDKSKSQEDQSTLLAQVAALVQENVQADNVQEALTQFRKQVQTLKDKRQSLLHDYETKVERLQDKLTAGQVPWDGKFQTSTTAELTHWHEQLIASVATGKKVLPDIYTQDPERSLDALQKVAGPLYQRKQWSNELQALDQEQQRQHQQLTDTQELLEVLPQQLAGTKKDRDLAEAQLKLLQEKQERIMAQQSLAEIRASLQTGKPCPVCGSTEHPLVKHGLEEAPSQTEVQAAREQYEQLMKEVLEQQSDLDNLSAKAKELTDALQERKEQIEVKEKALSTLTLSLDDYWLSLDVDQAIETQQDIQQQLSLWVKQQRQVRALEEARPICIELDTIKVDGKTIKQELDERYQGEDIHADVEALQEEWREVVNHRKALNQRWEEVVHEEKQVRSASEQLEQQVSKPLRELGYANIQAAVQARLSESTATGWREQKSAIDQQLTELTAKYKEQQVMLVKEQKAVAGTDADTLQAQLVSAHEQLMELEPSRRQLTSLIDRQLSIIKDLKELAVTIAKEEEANEKWRLLNEYIGSRGGDKFARFAQGLTLKQLTRLANIRLEQITTRYWLDTPEDNEDDSLIVIDRDMGDERRSVKTLSGGETFLVSLALALALSDLAAQSVKIESIFIDEGFGTLDPEVLDQTLDVLERLQLQDNKTIGIISHVAALKERITTQIQLQQDGQGYSRITLSN